MGKYKFDKDFLSEFRGLIVDFASESDRAVVILGAAKLDVQLYQLIVKVLRTPPSSGDELFEGDSPLSTFSAKINLAYRLGLIDNELTRTLHLIRKIRNSFAHETSSSSLNHGPHQNRIRESSMPLKRFEDYSDFSEFIMSFLKITNQDASAEFRILLIFCSIRLEVAIGSCTPIMDFKKREVSLRPYDWENKREIFEKEEEEEKDEKEGKTTQNKKGDKGT